MFATGHLVLSDGEWDLISQLLRQERAARTSELHHTDSRWARDEIEVRLKMINRLLERMDLSATPGAGECDV